MSAKPKGFQLDKGVIAGDTDVFVMNFHKKGVPINKSGSLFFYTAKVSLDDDDAAAVIRVEPGSVIFANSDKHGAENDQVRIPLSSVNTTLAPGEYFHDIQEVDGGEVTTIATGSLVISKGSTDRVS